MQAHILTVDWFLSGWFWFHILPIQNLESDSHKLFKQHHEFCCRGNHVYLLWFSCTPIIYASKAEYANFVFGSPVNLWKSSHCKCLHERFHTALWTGFGPEWKHRQRLITPSYHFFNFERIRSNICKTWKRV